MYSFYTPSTGRAEAEGAADALKHGILSTGEIVEKFEAAFADACGTDEGVAVASGSVALELALQASTLSSGDRVIVSPFNCTAVLYAIKRCDLQPVFVDIDPSTYNLDTDAVAATLANDTTINGLILTPTYGLPEDVETLEKIAESHDLTLVNDFCQAPGARMNGELTNNIGDVGVCSFGPTKPVTTGEGGIVLTDDTSIAESVRQARSNSGVDRVDPPTNVRMSDIEASIGLAQLSRYDSLVECRRLVASTYRAELPSVVVPQTTPPDRTHVYHRFPVRVQNRDRLQSYLHANGVESSVGINKPLYEFECAKQYSGQPCPQTERLINDCLLLPMHPGLEPTDARNIVDTVSTFYN